MDLFHLGTLGDCHQCRRLAPAARVHMDEGEQPLAHRARIDQRRHAANRTAFLEPLDPFMGGGCRKAHPLAQLGVADCRILDQNG